MLNCDYETCVKRVLNDQEESIILNLDVNNDSDPSIAVSSSDKNIRVLSLGTLKPLNLIRTKSSKRITDLKFSRINPHLLYCSSKDGYIYTWDLRSSCEEVVLKYDSKTDQGLVGLNCFDLNSNENTLVGGTDISEEDAFVLFWDCRSTRFQGAYLQSHADDITQVSFNPVKTNILASGCVDGLINIFDVKQTNEEDALTNTLNVECSVLKINWLLGDESEERLLRDKRLLCDKRLLGNKSEERLLGDERLLSDGNDLLSCTTTNEEIQIWDWTNVEMKMSRNRKDLKKTGISKDLDFLLNSFNFKNNELFLASGNNFGKCQIWNIEKKEPVLFTTLENGGHKDTVRCLKNYKDLFVTGGEDGAVCVWKETTDKKVETSLNTVFEERTFKNKLVSKEIRYKKPY